MAEEDDLTAYYIKIRDRGWGCWVHGIKAGFMPIMHPEWEKKTQKVSADRQVTVTWDPMKFTDTLGDREAATEVYRNDKYHVLLFPVLVA